MQVQVNERVFDVDEQVIGVSEAEQVKINVGEARVKRFAKAALGDSFTHDNYFAKMMADEKTARLFFELFLPKRILRSIDLESLRAAPTKFVDEKGAFCVGDMIYTVDMKRRKGKKTRRAVFVLVLEHKSEHEKYVSIQLLKYIAGVLDFMRADPEKYQDENGLLPSPYPIVFSQSKRSWKRVPYLNRILWAIKGLGSYMVRFKFQVIEASEISLEKIKKLEPVMRVFLYMERLAKREYEKGENQELIDLFSDIILATTPDERLRQAVLASFGYLKYLQKGRPQMITVQELQDEIYEQNDESDYAAFQEFFPDLCDRKYEEGLEKGLEKGRVLNIYDMILKYYRHRYNVDVPETLSTRINAISYYPALEEIQYAAWSANSPSEFERGVDAVIEKYAEEIEALNKKSR